jgi:membrane fusion protein (multidrug efflux system)
MSLNVDVNLHDQNGPMLSQQPPTQPAFSTDVYERQAAKADAEIAQIIHANMAGGSK